MSRSELCKATGKSSKVVAENLKRAEKELLVDSDQLERYSLTPFGRAVAGENDSEASFFTFDAYSLSIAPVAIMRQDLPVIKCSIFSPDADTIMKNNKRIDLAEVPESQNNFQPANGTKIQKAVANLIDEILDAKADAIGMDRTQTGENRDNLISNLPISFPGYDNIKRMRVLTDTKLKVLCEFDGKAWLEAHDIAEEERKQEESAQRQKEQMEKNLRSMSFERRLESAAGFLQFHISTDKDDLKKLESRQRLFENKEKIKDTASRLLAMFFPEEKGPRRDALLQLLEKEGIIRYKELRYYTGVIDTNALKRFLYYLGKKNVR